jgi:hypothetical protein
MTDDKDELIRQLTIRLRETVEENDKLRVLVERITEGASAHETLSELHRNRDLPPAIRAKAAIGCLGVETAPLKSVEPPLDLVAEPPTIPLAELVEQRRARQDRMQRERRNIEVYSDGTVRVLPKPGNGSGDSSND